MQDEITPDGDGNKAVYTLDDLSKRLKRTVESVFDHVRVRAEVSRPTRAASGHLYFTLKDDQSTLDAVCWKGVAAGLTTMPEEGLEVIVTGKISTFPGRSKYQIVVQDVEIAGEGAILKQLEERRRRLAAEGLFDPERKKSIPAMPRVIGVVTSPTGAVIRDILHRLSERFPVHVLVWPVLVQGDAAAPEIAAAINGFDGLIDNAPAGMPVPDTVIVARGGGSLEDLMAFNDEAVVRAAAACRLPLISAVGHETDTTLIDHAADRRAPTPTAAAEMATPVAAEIEARLNESAARISRAMGRKIEDAGERLRGLERAMGDPGLVIESRGQRLDLASRSLDQQIDACLAEGDRRLGRVRERLPTPAQQLADAQEALGRLTMRGDQVIENLLRAKAEKLGRRGERLVPPVETMARGEARLALLVERLAASLRQRVETAGQRLEQASRLLESTSFQRTLDRGFAIVSTAEGSIMRSAAEAPDGQPVLIRFADGQRDAVLGEGDGTKPSKPVRPKRSPRADDSGQGDLF
ncbi:MAG: exodeoxyribonuclease VII large subunit [Candidatus Puniceispirillales bacterium]